MRSPHHNRHRETASRGPPVRAASFRFCCRYRQDPRARSRRREKFQPFYAPAIINGGSSTAQAKDLLGRRSEEHTSELQSLMRISYAVFCLKKKKNLQKKRQVDKH